MARECSSSAERLAGLEKNSLYAQCVAVPVPTKQDLGGHQQLARQYMAVLQLEEGAAAASCRRDSVESRSCRDPLAATTPSSTSISKYTVPAVWRRGVSVARSAARPPPGLHTLSVGYGVVMHLDQDHSDAETFVPEKLSEASRLLRATPA